MRAKRRWGITRLGLGSHAYFVVLVTSYFRDLASAPEVRRRARAGAVWFQAVVQKELKAYTKRFNRELKC